MKKDTKIDIQLLVFLCFGITLIILAMWDVGSLVFEPPQEEIKINSDLLDKNKIFLDCNFIGENINNNIHNFPEEAIKLCKDYFPDVFEENENKTSKN